jgi:hypothetical protein
MSRRKSEITGQMNERDGTSRILSNWSCIQGGSAIRAKNLSHSTVNAALSFAEAAAGSCPVLGRPLFFVLHA